MKAQNNAMALAWAMQRAWDAKSDNDGHWVQTADGMHQPSLGQFAQISTHVLESLGIDPLEAADTMPRAIQVEALRATDHFEPHFKRLRLPVDGRIVGVAEKLVPMGAFEIGLGTEPDRFSIELYLHRFGTLAAILDHQKNRVSGGEVSFHLLTVKAEQVAAAHVVTQSLAGLIGLDVQTVEPSVAHEEVRGIAAVLDRGQRRLRLLASRLFLCLAALCRPPARKLDQPSKGASDDKSDARSDRLVDGGLQEVVHGNDPAAANTAAQSGKGTA
jgi:hypothetical protein